MLRNTVIYDISDVFHEICNYNHDKFIIVLGGYMCCFSGPVTSVSATKIFARIHQERQYLVYEMNLSTEHELAMVLPIPIHQSAETGIQFINLESYPNFFADIKSLYPVPRGRRGR